MEKLDTIPEVPQQLCPILLAGRNLGVTAVEDLTIDGPACGGCES
ncbi:hypothetical protein AB0B28_06695 [Glycomyces sp. NPDC046736]